MDQPRFDRKPPIPAVELSRLPLEIEIPAARPLEEPNAPPPINLDGDGSDKVDENELSVRRDEEGGYGPVRYTAQPASPVTPLKRK